MTTTREAVEQVIAARQASGKPLGIVLAAGEKDVTQATMQVQITLLQ